MLVRLDLYMLLSKVPKFIIKKNNEKDQNLNIEVRSFNFSPLETKKQNNK
jgi:hypothetical protein